MSARAGALGVPEPEIAEASRIAAPAKAAVAALPRPVFLPQGLVQTAPSRWSFGALKAALAQALETRRLFVLQPFVLILGMIGYAQLPVEPQPVALGIIAAIVLLLMAVSWADIARFRLLSLLAGFWIGACLLPLHGLLFGTPMLAYPVYGEYEARVDEILSQTDDSRRIVVSALVPLAGARDPGIVRARLVTPPQPPLAPGDIIQAKLRLAPVPGPVLPGAFDGQFHAYFAGIGAYGNVTSGLSLVSAASGPDPSRGVETIRNGIATRIAAVLHGEAAAIGTALIIGDQSAITEDTRDAMAGSGLAHVYSISGLHLSLVAGGMFFLLRLAMAAASGWTGTWPVKKIAAIGGLLVACFYLMLAGGLANVPALRSTIMLGLIFGAILAGRRALTMRNVAIAALAIIVIDPASVFRASFQLSFAAVVALIGAYELPRRQREGEQGWIGRFAGHIGVAALTSLIAGAATLLFSAYHFQQTAPLGVLGNILVLPIVSFVIMPFALLSVLAMPLDLEAPFLGVMGWGIDRMLDGARLITAWSQGLDANPLLNGYALLIGLVALAWFAFVNTVWRFLGPALVLPAVLLIGLDQRPDILIADSTQAVAIRNGDQVGLVTGRAGTFAVNVWSEHYQEEIGPQFAGARCDSLACIVTTPGFSVSVVKSPEAFAEDCALHDLVIARMQSPAACRGITQVIDADQLAAGGVHWLKWDEGGGRFIIRTAIPNLTRPWRPALR